MNPLKTLNPNPKPRPPQVIEWPHEDPAAMDGGEDDGALEVDGIMPSKYSFAIGAEGARKQLQSMTSKKGGYGALDEDERTPIV